MAGGPCGYADTKAERGIGSQVRSLLELEPVALHRQILAWASDGRSFLAGLGAGEAMATTRDRRQVSAGGWGTRSASAHAFAGEGCRAGRTDRRRVSQSGEEGSCS